MRFIKLELHDFGDLYISLEVSVGGHSDPVLTSASAYTSPSKAGNK